MNDFSNKVVHFIVNVLVSTDQLTDRPVLGPIVKSQLFYRSIGEQASCYRPVVLGPMVKGQLLYRSIGEQASCYRPVVVGPVVVGSIVTLSRPARHSVSLPTIVGLQ